MAHGRWIMSGCAFTPSRGRKRHELTRYRDREHCSVRRAKLGVVSSTCNLFRKGRKEGRKERESEVWRSVRSSTTSIVPTRQMMTMVSAIVEKLFCILVCVRSLHYM